MTPPKVQLFQQVPVYGQNGTVQIVKSSNGINVGTELIQSTSATTASANVNSLENTLAAVNALGETVDGVAKTKNANALSSEDMLNNITNAQDYVSVKDTLAQIDASRDELVSSYNDEVNSYLSDKTASVLGELGVQVPALTPISGKKEDYDEDMKSLSEDQGKLGNLASTCEQKLPDVVSKRESAQAKVSELKSQKGALHRKIIAAKLSFSKSGREKLPALRAELAKVKEQLNEAKQELEKYKAQEKALKEGSKKAQEKIQQIDKNKADLTNFRDAEIEAVDKTYEIAQTEDATLEEQINAIKEKRTEIENAEQEAQNSVSDEAEGAEDAQLQKLEQLYTEYGALVAGMTNVTTDLGVLIKDNEGKTSVENNEGSSYEIKNYDEAVKIIEEEKEKEAEKAKKNSTDTTSALSEKVLR